MTTIQSHQDFATKGDASPLTEPLHVGRPNIGDRNKFFRRIDDILDRRWLTNNGPMVEEFEARIAQYLGVRHCVAICNGTIALEIAIRALGLEGEVIVPSYTFIATAHALHWQAITPVFADIDPSTHHLDPEAVRCMITPRTTGIIGVHLWGRAAPHAELQAIADEYGLKLMYDAAHAFGCSYQSRTIGSLGICEVLSFHATKVLNTVEGGAVVTNDEVLAQKVRLMRNFGFAGYDDVIYPGTNGKLNEICAAMGLTNLDHIDEFIAANRRNYEEYSLELANIPGLGLLRYDEAERNNYQYVVLEIGENFPASRDDVVAALHAKNILARRYFWPGAHAMKPYRDLFPHARLLLPNTERVAARVVILPTGTAVDIEHIHLVADLLRSLADSTPRASTIAAAAP